MARFVIVSPSHDAADRDASSSTKQFVARDADEAPQASADRCYSPLGTLDKTVGSIDAHPKERRCGLFAQEPIDDTGHTTGSYGTIAQSCSDALPGFA